MKRLTAFLFVCLLAFTASAQALTYSLPYLGVRAQLDEGITSLGQYENEWLMQTDDGITLSVKRTKGDAPKAEDYDHAPYENVRESEKFPGYLQMEYTAQGHGETVSRVQFLAHANDSLYVFSAEGSDVSALYDTLESFLSSLSFQTLHVMEVEAPSVELPAAIADDGRQIPLSLENFTGLSLEDKTEVTVRTLPGALVALITPSDELYENADENGLCSFILSTRKEQVYSYTVMVRADSRASSQLDFSIERRYSLYSATAAYRSSTKKLENLGYSKVVNAPEKYADTAVSFRGKITLCQDADGFPCLLVYTHNPSRGVWEDPVWARFSTAFALNLEDIRTFYGNLSSQTLPYEGSEIPVVDVRGISEE